MNLKKYHRACFRRHIRYFSKLPIPGARDLILNGLHPDVSVADRVAVVLQ